MKRVCIVTGTRADWGIFYPLAVKLRDSDGHFTLKIIASGAHLSKAFGLTRKEISDDGFKIDEKVKIPLSSNNEELMSKAVAAGIKGFTKAIGSIKPDIILLLGDRFEILAAALSAFFLKIPIAHIHGGEITEGSMDDVTRHIITKLSTFHFTSTEVYRKRVIQMGEEASRVWNVGALGLDNINDELLEKDYMESKLGLKFGERNIMVTFNPPTLERAASVEKQFKSLLAALKLFKGVNVIFTKPTPDIYSKEIAEILEDHVSRNKKNTYIFTSMGRRFYLSALRLVDAVVGNSSSGIIEAPSVGIPTVNIGTRQAGRVRAESVIDCGTGKEDITSAIAKALSQEYRDKSRNVVNPYRKGSASLEIVRILKKIKLDEGVIKKKFFDIDYDIEKKWVGESWR